jgi:hypothetical protein
MILVTRFYVHGNGLKGIWQRLQEVTSRDKIHVLVSYILKSLNRMFSVVLHMCFFFSPSRRIPVPNLSLDEKMAASCFFLSHRNYPFIISACAKRTRFIFLNNEQQHENRRCTLFDLSCGLFYSRICSHLSKMNRIEWVLDLVLDILQLSLLQLIRRGVLYGDEAVKWIVKGRRVLSVPWIATAAGARNLQLSSKLYIFVIFHAARWRHEYFASLSRSQTSASYNQLTQPNDILLEKGE